MNWSMGSTYAAFLSKQGFWGISEGFGLSRGDGRVLTDLSGVEKGVERVLVISKVITS